MNSDVKASLITHMIAGYPDFEKSLEVARGLIAGGAYALEIQIPFSDPNADGPLIENACRVALSRGFKVADTWRLLEVIRAESSIPIFLMSYASTAISCGLANFLRRAVEFATTGIIIPNLVPGADEGLFRTAAELGCPAVPVLVPWISDQRLDEILSMPIDWIYVALRSGITGAYTQIEAPQRSFLAKIRTRQRRPRIMAGFGIQKTAQVANLLEFVEAAVVGSAIVKTISGARHPGEAVRKLVGELQNIKLPKTPG
ncbi:hypothetical protein S1OALGB6SA_1339 [Olavius algarvensis spirochete endosymbiont]|uniref:tryptophan synthase subunit alpha n=1 Tax=Olavius algarvensis spirochete endosymbiont TaxID=260710 RepID=UPI00052CDE82|nr:tryptophan synthase subunit alpha [Olavius algarvensis spirochete endosymbiont]KGM38653.1 hypothetical protein JY97_15045 [Alkalispirochaeta odontotermitis]VDB00264.1 hypothetical protein S1OALGB6SA_1339 [Olavius algarvensis spirochete endosymbiont]